VFEQSNGLRSLRERREIVGRQTDAALPLQSVGHHGEGSAVEAAEHFPLERAKPGDERG